MNNWPYTNMHELNLDWIITEIKHIEETYGDIDAAADAAIARIQEQENLSLEELNTAKATILSALTAAQNLAIAAIDADKAAALGDIEDKAEEAVNLSIDAINQAGTYWNQHVNSLLADMPADLASLTQTMAIIGNILTGDADQDMTWFIGDYIGGSKHTYAASSDASTNLIIGGAGLRFTIKLEAAAGADTKLYKIVWFTGKGETEGTYTGQTEVSMGLVSQYTWTVPDSCYAFSVIVRNSVTYFTSDPVDIASMKWRTDYSDLTNQVEAIEESIAPIIFNGNQNTTGSTVAAGSWIWAQLSPVDPYKLYRVTEDVVNNDHVSGSNTVLIDVENEVTPLKSALDDITENVYGTNRFDGTTTDGYLGEDGVITNSPPGTAWKTTDYIYAADLTAVCIGAKNSSEYYAQRKPYYLCQYNAERTLLARNTSSSLTYITLESNTVYIRACYDSLLYHDVQVQGGETVSPYEAYTPPEMHIKPIGSDYVITDPATGETLDTTLEDIEDRISDTEALFTIDYCKNRFDGTTETGYLDSSGNIHANPSDGHYISTGYCYVADLETICASAVENGGRRIALRLNFLCFYTAAKAFISRASSPYPFSADLPENTAYVRFSYDERYYTYVQLESGDTPTPYVAYAAPITKLKAQNSYNGFLSRWSGIKWAAVGDSLTEVNQRTTLHYHDYIALESGILVYNMGVSGSGYAALAGSSKAFYQRISDVPLDTDVVTIFGSGNDNSTGLEIGEASDTGTTTLCGCINTTIDNLYAVLPTVQLGIVSPTPWESQNPNTPTNFMTRYSKALQDICTARGIPFLDLYHCSGLRPWESSYRELCYSKDEGNGVHPNELGHKIIAPHFAAFLSELIINY